MQAFLSGDIYEPWNIQRIPSKVGVITDPAIKIARGIWWQPECEAIWARWKGNFWSSRTLAYLACDGQETHDWLGGEFKMGKTQINRRSFLKGLCASSAVMICPALLGKTIDETDKILAKEPLIFDVQGSGGQLSLSNYWAPPTRLDASEIDCTI